METNIKENDFIVMTIIALGEVCDNYGFIYQPKLPSCFTENVTLNGHEAALHGIGVNSDFEIECVFIGEEEEVVFCPLKSIEEFVPWLYASILTHLNDMVNMLMYINNL